MSTFAQSHSLPTYEQRKAAKAKESGVKKSLSWINADELVTEVYCDICNGLVKSEIVEKITKGLYEHQKKPLSVRSAGDYLDAAYRRMAFDFEAQAEQMRADLYSKLMTIYHDAIEVGDRNSAIQVIDRIMKLTGCAADKPTTAVQINNTAEGVTISFGFDKKEEQEFEGISEVK